ncbi:MAG: amidase [Pseudomonadota bacterium]
MTSPVSLLAQPLKELREQVAAGVVSAVELTTRCLARIEAREHEIGAWAWIDPAAALAQAEALDRVRATGAPVGPLHGLPIGLKDVIDTAGVPTENGCPVDAGRVPAQNALLVDRLRAAGAVMLGKTVTTELAYMHPGKTRNPWNPAHTPGGSSSGSAAAVADAMVPLAVGTQTGGSVIRPASFCGVVGFKPSKNAIPRDGVLMQSHSLDTVGVFARDPWGAALLADVLADRAMADTSPTEAWSAGAPRFGFVRVPDWEMADPALQDGLTAFCASLGEVVEPASLPESFRDCVQHRDIINAAEMGHYYRRYLAAGADRLGAPTRETIERGQAMQAAPYVAALALREALAPSLSPLFDRYDALIVPAAVGPAPAGHASTGDSRFNGLWTMAGTPAVTLPLLAAPNGLPMGVQLVGPVGGDAGLMRAASWLWERAVRRS